MDPLFHIEDEVGLERPPVGELGPGEALGAPAPAPAAPAVAIIVCPNCGCQDCGGGQDPAVQMADQASVVCPQCQCEFGHGQQPEMGAEVALPMESSVTRILGRVFERHIRRHAHALRRTQQPKLPGNAS